MEHAERESEIKLPERLGLHRAHVDAEELAAIGEVGARTGDISSLMSIPT